MEQRTPLSCIINISILSFMNQLSCDICLFLYQAFFFFFLSFYHFFMYYLYMKNGSICHIFSLVYHLPFIILPFFSFVIEVQLIYNCMVCYVQVYSKVIQLHIYRYLIFFKLFSLIGYYKILSVAPCCLSSLYKVICVC